MKTDQTSHESQKIAIKIGNKTPPRTQHARDMHIKRDKKHRIKPPVSTSQFDGGFSEEMAHERIEVQPPVASDEVEDLKSQSERDNIANERKTEEAVETEVQEDSQLDVETSEISEDLEDEDDPSSQIAEKDMVYESDEDFYSSKLEVAGQDKKASKSVHSTHSRRYPIQTGRYVRFAFILTLFIATTAAGIAMLYILERLQSGSGLIF